MLARLKSVDIYRKASADFHKSTISGGLLSLLSLTVVLILLLSQTYSHMFPKPKFRFQVEPHSPEDFITISTNISFSSLPCNSIVSYYTDTSYTHYTFYSLNRSVLSSTGEVLSTISSSLTEQPIEGCGTCYGAELYPNHCCNTCAEVMEAYGRKKWKPPQFFDIQQCQMYLSDDSIKGPGCLLSGDMKVKKMPGSIHFRNTFQVSNKFYLEHNAGHKVEKFAFKDPSNLHIDVQGPVDGNVVENAFQTNYYFKIMPAVKKEGRFYESSSNFLNSHHKINPEVLFTYDIEPISSIFVEDEGVMEFLVSICAIIGGWYAVTLLLAKFLVK